MRAVRVSNSKINGTPNGVYLPISKLPSIYQEPDASNILCSVFIFSFETLFLIQEKIKQFKTKIISPCFTIKLRIKSLK